jgi:hypothetical protein
MRYRCAHAAGGTTFFTVNLAERRSDLLVRHIDDLLAAMKTVKDTHPVAVVIMVVLPPNTRMRYGACHRAIPTIRYAGRSSRPGSRGGWQKASRFEPATKPSVSAASGSDGIGNIKSGMKHKDAG